MVKYIWHFFILFCTANILNAQETKPIELKKVTIKGSNKALKQNAKGAVLDITKIPNYKLLTLAEILTYIPGVEVNDGSITYMGRQLALMRDGVNVAGFANQIANSLGSGNTQNAYNKIELNLYNLKTEGPTLSFTATKYDEGYFGNVAASAGSNSSMLITGVSLSKEKNLLNLNTSGMFQYAPSSSSLIETKFKQTQTTDIRATDNDGIKMKNSTVSLSNSYFINNHNTLNASVSTNFFNTNYLMKTHLQQYQAGVLKNNANTLLKNNSNFWRNPTYLGKLSYVYKPKAKENSSQRFDIAIEYDDKQTADIAQAASSSLLNNFVLQDNYTTINGTKDNNVFGLVGYEYHHDKLGSFEVVGRYFNRKNLQTYQYNYQTDANGNTDIILQKNNISYNYAALLASWDKSFEKFSLRLVIKQDYSKDYISSIKGRDNFSFSTFSPYISVQKNLKVGSLHFEAKYSQLRPALNNMSNVVDYGAQFNASNYQTIGNPYLKPSKTLLLSNIYTTNIKSVGIVFTTEYENVTDAISSYQTTDGEVRIRTFRNLAKRNNYTANLSLNFYLFPRFTVQLYANNNFYRYKITEQEKTNTFYWADGIRLSYTPIPTLRLGANFGVSGGSTLQFKTRAQLNSGFNIGTNFGKVNLNLNVSNFHQPYFNNYNWIDANGYSTYTKSRSRRIMGLINASYAFGKVTKPAKVTGKQITKDDM